MTPKKPTKKSITDLRAEVNASVDAKADQILSSERAAARTYLAEASVDKLLGQFTNMSLDLGNKLAGLGEQVRVAFGSLQSLQVAIKEAEDRLQDLHDIDAAQTSLDQVVAAYDAQEKALNDAMATAREQWQSEQDSRNRTWLFDASELQVARRRDQETYQYQTAQQRQKDADEYNFAKTQRDRQEAVERTGRTLILDARDNALKAAETELGMLRTQVAAIPAQTKKEVDTAVAIACNSLKRDLTHEAAMATQRLQSELALANQAKAEALAQQKTMTDEVARLNKQLAESHAQVQIIAAKALEAASGARALDEMRSVTKDLAAGGNNKK